METYELMGAPIYPNRAYSLETHETLEETRNVLHLPKVYCRNCEIRYLDNDVPILEARRLPEDHPLLIELRALAIRAEKEKKKVSKDLSRLMGGYPENVPRGHPIWEQLDESGTVPPEKFWEIADELRRLCSLPESRRIHPGNRLGELEVNRVRARIPDLFQGMLDGLPVVVTERTVQALKDAGCTGYNLYPVKVAHSIGNRPVPTLFELEVVGSGGLPGPGSSPWEMKECPVCGLTSVTGPMDGRYALDSAQHDGSDIFCFDHWRFVFVTERFKNAVENAKLTGAQFRPCTTSRDDWRARTR